MLYFMRIIRLGVLAAEQIGGKALGLSWLQERGFRVPSTWVLDTHAFDLMIEASGLADLMADIEEATRHRLDWASVERVLQSLEPVRRQAVETLLSAPLPKGVCAALEPLHRYNRHWAVRSSATIEDGIAHSFAGQFNSFLFVPGGEPLIHAIRQVWASTLSENALHYRIFHGTPMPRMAVILQPMGPITIRDRSGVAFSQSPLPGEPGVLIQATFGAGLTVVGEGSGEIKCVNGTSVKTLGRTTTCAQVTAAAGGLQSVPQPANPVLPDVAAFELALQVQRVALLYGRPVDVEFFWPENDPPTLLQVRPISKVA